MVCGAPTPRNSSGRSAVTTSMGTAGQPSLDDRGEEVGRRGAARTQQERRNALESETEGDEAGDTLVVDHVGCGAPHDR